jgi:hypothetical protein
MDTKIVYFNDEYKKNKYFLYLLSKGELELFKKYLMNLIQEDDNFLKKYI